MRKVSVHTSPRRKSHFLSVWVLSAWLLPIPADAQNYGNRVEVCNNGDIDLSFIYFATNSSLFGGEQAKIAGWYTIEPRDCGNINPSGLDTVAVGFLQVNDKGVRGNPVYVLENATAVGGTDWAPSVICAPINDSLSYKSGLGVVTDKYTPPCEDGFAPYRMSFGVIPNDVFPEYHLEPKGSDALNAWPAGAVQQAAVPTESKSEMSGLEVAARIAIGAAQGLEDGKVRKLSKSCGKSALVFVFNFSKEGPAKACECFSRQIVRGEPSSVVSRLIAEVDSGPDFDAAVDKLPAQNVERYLESCISAP
jgi:hypothetical protein